MRCYTTQNFKRHSISEFALLLKKGFVVDEAKEVEEEEEGE